MAKVLKVWVDADTCVCHAACEHFAPQLFVVGDGLYPRVRVAGELVDARSEQPATLPLAMLDAVNAGIRVCPVAAIHVSADEEA